MKLRIAENLSLPADTVTSTLIIYGGKGMGKTNLGSVIVEELDRAKLRWGVLDPLGVWWGLRHSKDGKGPGIECVILGGVHGDIPIEPTGGSVVADMMVDETANLIIDFSRKPSGEMWGVGEKIRFVTDYTRRVFQRQGELVDGRRREPMFQFLDEAARYIPQVIPHGSADVAKCVSAWETLVEEGRNVGIGVGLLTQRSARMNKSVSEVADAMFSFRIVGPNSIAAVMDWMGEHVPKADIKSHIETLRSLERGRCLVVSPGWLQFEGIADIRERETFDSSATPKPGERPQKVTGKAAKPDLAKYQERMKETIERVKADDPKELRRQIQQLNTELRSKKQTAAPAPADPGLSARAIKRAVDEATKPLLRQLELTKRQAKTAIDNFVKAAAPLNAIANMDLPIAPAYAEHPAPAGSKLLGHTVYDHQKQESKFVPTAPRAAVESNGNGDLTPGEKTILAAVVQFDGVDSDQLGVLTGYKSTSRYEYARQLAQKGYIAKSGDRLTPTPEGIAALGSDYEPLPTGFELYRWWSTRLGGVELVLLRHLVEVKHGQAVSNEELMEAANIKSTSLYEYTRKLATRRLVVKDRTGARASESLFG